MRTTQVMTRQDSEVSCSYKWEGHGDFVSRLILGIFGVIMCLIRVVNLLAKFP